MLHIYDQRFDVTENLEHFCELNKTWVHDNKIQVLGKIESWDNELYRDEMVQIFFDRIRNRIRLVKFKSVQHPILFVFEYSNRIFIVSIFYPILSNVTDTVRIHIR